MLTSIDPVTSRLTAHVTCPVITLYKTSLRKKSRNHRIIYYCSISYTHMTTIIVVMLNCMR